MSRAALSAGTESSLPMWDTFEASFFMGAGLSVGLVLGILFPSLWRSFRRRFRNTSQYAPKFETLDSSIYTTLTIIKAPDNEQEPLQNAVFEQKNDSVEESSEVRISQAQFDIAEMFVLARNFFQVGNIRQAIQLYIALLTHENISKVETSRALYELSQVYFASGLPSRAFDTALELLNRKPSRNDVLQHILKICAQGFSPSQLTKALNLYKGTPDYRLRISIAHELSRVGETYLEKGSVEKALEVARKAVMWERSSARAMILLWQTTSYELWKRSEKDPKMMWAALSTDLEALLQIIQTTKVSHAAGAIYLAKLIVKMSSNAQIVENYALIEHEFESSLRKEKNNPTIEKSLWTSIFHAVLLIHKSFELKSGHFLSEILTIVSGNKESLNFITQQSQASILGYAVHACEKCNAFYSSFTWKCSRCHFEETLKPVVFPPLLGEVN